ncbi:MAG: hypothetical protein ACFE9D_00840 [Promethearchaeota archaeon]
MADAQTASTLTLVAGILQIVFSMIFIVLGVMVFGFMLWPFMYDPFVMMYTPMWVMLIPLLLFGVFGVIGLIFGVLWLNWRHFAVQHKTGLIVSGILAMVFSIGFIPGLLALLAGALAPTTSEYTGYIPVQRQPVSRSTVRVVTRCPSCNAEIVGDDRFCWRCGTKL